VARDGADGVPPCERVLDKELPGGAVGPENHDLHDGLRLITMDSVPYYYGNHSNIGGMTPAADPVRDVLDALLELRLELSLLNHRIAAEAGLNDADLDCLEVISRQGPTSPARLTRRLRIHPATMTGILARLVDSGWIERTADPGDRRASVLTIAGQRDAQLRERYAAPRQAVAEAISARSPGDAAVVAAMLNDLAGRVRDARLGQAAGGAALPALYTNSGGRTTTAGDVPGARPVVLGAEELDNQVAGPTRRHDREDGQGVGCSQCAVAPDGGLAVVSRGDTG
jgi:DNA-binding MarR family transcriptional regulator